jgi:membrane-bound serine protease (ClpP class)
MLTNEVPGVPVGLNVIVPVVIALAGIMLGLGRLALRAQRRPAVTGAEGLVGGRGVALTEIGPGLDGQVRVHGEIWRASGAAGLRPGDAVRVTAVAGLTLAVEPADPPAPEGGIR